MSKIVKTKFLCKNGMQTGKGKGKDFSKNFWVDKFIEGKWYDGEYETWSWEDGYRVNGGWRKYWIIDEQGLGGEISRAQFRTIFETDEQKLRDNKLDNILKKDNE